MESHELQNGAVIRHLNISNNTKKLQVRLANKGIKVACDYDLKIIEKGGFIVAEIPANETSLNVSFTIGSEVKAAVKDLTSLIKGGPAQWPQELKTKIVLKEQTPAFKVETLSSPKIIPGKVF